MCEGTTESESRDGWPTSGQQLGAAPSQAEWGLGCVDLCTCLLAVLWVFLEATLLLVGHNSIPDRIP